MSAFPGYEYDERRQCYFRVVPKHFRQIYQDDTADCRQKAGSDDIIDNNSHSLYRFLQRRERCADRSAHSLRVVSEYFMLNLKKENMLQFGDIPPNSQYDDILVNGSGDLCAVQFISGGDTICKLYSLKSMGKDCLYEELSSTAVAPVQGFYSMAFSGDQNQFMKLDSDTVSVCDSLNNWKPRHGLKLSKGANCIALCPTAGHWHKEYVAIGFHHGNIEVYNSKHKLTYKNSHVKSSILAAAFSLQDPLLFTGSRNGSCVVWDTRSSRPAMSVKEPPVGSRQSSSVIGLHPLQDHNYIVSNALNSRLSMWDLRMQRKILLFSEHVNEYRHCKSVVDKLGLFVAAAGSDGAVRIWSTRTGTLLLCLHGLSASNDVPPQLTYSLSLGGASGRPALLVTHNNAISSYHV